MKIAFITSGPELPVGRFQDKQGTEDNLKQFSFLFFS